MNPVGEDGHDQNSEEAERKSTNGYEGPRVRCA